MGSHIDQATGIRIDEPVTFALDPTEVEQLIIAAEDRRWRLKQEMLQHVPDGSVERRLKAQVADLSAAIGKLKG